MQAEIFKHFLKVKSVCTDTRRIKKNSIFFALKGESFNGNQYVNQALEMGASMAVADEQPAVPDERIIVVTDALRALQMLAGDYRKTFDIPFLAITGSNGKTTTKELIRNVLRKKFRVSATVGNLNNHIGVPLTMLSIPADCEFAVIEMGANHQGEIRSYCDYAQPDYGMITNMGKAHLEGFGGFEGVKKGKKELFDYISTYVGKVFVNVELENLKEAAEANDIIPYGFHQRGFELTLLSESPVVSYHVRSQEFSGGFMTNLAGAYNLFNIASAIAVGKYFGVTDLHIHEAISNYMPDNNRSQLKKSASNTLIMDAYNANPSSMEHALQSLSRQESAHKFFIVGDMRELGEEGFAEHRRMLQLCVDLGLNGITVGPVFLMEAAGFSFPAFVDNAAAIEYLKSHPMKDHLILVKGSRGIHLEDLVDVL